MKLPPTQINPICNVSFVSFVKTTLEDGSVGFGQMSTYHADITAQIFHKQVAPWILNKSWEDFDDTESDFTSVKMQVRSTNDDPSASPS